MDTRQRPTIGDVTLVVVLVVAVAAVFALFFDQAAATQPAQASPTTAPAVAEGYPPPAPTAPPPQAYPAPSTPGGPVAIFVSPEPTPTTDPLWLAATPAFADGITYDVLNRFSVRLPPGWHAQVPAADMSIGMATFTNYSYEELELLHNQPPDLVFIRITTHDLASDSTFDEWLSEQRQRQVSPEYGVPSDTTVSDNEPIKVGKYDGVGYYVSVPGDDIWQLMFVLSGEHRIISISINPINNPEGAGARADAFQILDTIDILP